YTTLFRSVAGVPLLERDDRHREATGGRGMGVDALDAGDADPVEVVPDTGRARDRIEERALVGGIIGHEGVCEDGVVTVVHGLDLHEEGVVLGAAVVAGELAEGPLELLRVGRDDSLHPARRARGRVDAR